MIVTDITRMKGTRICVGGYLMDGTLIRPTCLRNGPTEEWLQADRGAFISPFSVVDLEIFGPIPSRVPPHMEDVVVPESGHRLMRVLSESEQVNWLDITKSGSVREIFGADIHTASDSGGYFVRSGEGLRSLGTVLAGHVLGVSHQYNQKGRGWKYRLIFVDKSGDEFDLTVVDLAFRQRLDYCRDQGMTPYAAARSALDELRRQRVYLRIGLARGWDRHPDRCYLQITGVYGFSR